MFPALIAVGSITVVSIAAALLGALIVKVSVLNVALQALTVITVAALVFAVRSRIR